MKNTILSTVILMVIGPASAQSSFNISLPLPAIEQLKHIKVGEIIYRDASLLAVTEQLSTYLLATDAEGPATNISVVASYTAKPMAKPTRVSMTAVAPSLWEVITNVCRQADVAVRYENGNILLETDNTRDLPSFGRGARLPLGVTQQDAVGVSPEPVSVQISIRSEAGKNDYGIPVVNANYPIDVLVRLRPSSALHRSKYGTSVREIVYRAPAGEEILDHVELVKKNGVPSITVELKKWTGSEWEEVQMGRLLMTYDEGAFFDPLLGAHVTITHVRDPAKDMPTGIYRLSFTCHLHATVGSTSRDIHLRDSSEFEVRDISSSDEQYADAWASFYLRAASDELAPDEKSIAEMHLLQIGHQVLPGVNPRLDYKLAILAHRANLDDMAFTRTVEYLKRGGDQDLVLLDLLRKLTQRLGCKDPMPEIQRFRMQNAPAKGDIIAPAPIGGTARENRK